MPRDPRPYLTFPIGYTLHPRIDGLSDPAFRAFHEMNDYCRINMTKPDGVIPARIAEKRWGQKVIAELVEGDGTRPLVIPVDGGYFIRSYAEHQFTSDDAEALRIKRQEAGRAGGKAKHAAMAAAKQSSSKRLASASAAVKQAGSAEVAESKSESEADTNYLPHDALDPAAREFTAQEISDLVSVISSLVGAPVDDLVAVTATRMFLEAAPRPVTNVVGYVVRCIDRSPVKVRATVAEAQRQADRVIAELGGAA